MPVETKEVTHVVSDLEQAREAIEPVVASLGLELYDLEILGATGPGAGGARTLRVTVEREGGIDLDALTEASGAISSLLDADSPRGLGGGSYLLEVSSPGVERTLRRPEHFERAVGSEVSVKCRGEKGTERLRGTLVAADDLGCTLEIGGLRRDIAYSDVTAARTVFEWGPAARQGGSGSARRRAKEKSR